MKPKSLLLSLTLVGTLLLATPQPAFAQTTKEWTRGTCTDSVDADVATLQGVECLVGNVLNVAVTAIGLAAFVMFLVGSYLYLMSGGNPKGTEAGQKTITYAIIGVVVSLTGFIALNFISDFTGVKTIQNFTLDSEKITN